MWWSTSEITSTYSAPEKATERGEVWIFDALAPTEVIHQKKKSGRAICHGLPLVGGQQGGMYALYLGNTDRGIITEGNRTNSRAKLYSKRLNSHQGRRGRPRGYRSTRKKKKNDHS